jgi:hypothetical protein
MTFQSGTGGDIFEVEQTLAGEIADNLRAIIYVPRAHEGSFVARRGWIP